MMRTMIEMITCTKNDEKVCMITDEDRSIPNICDHCNPKTSHTIICPCCMSIIEAA